MDGAQSLLDEERFVWVWSIRGQRVMELEQCHPFNKCGIHIVSNIKVRVSNCLIISAILILTSYHKLEKWSSSTLMNIEQCLHCMHWQLASLMVSITCSIEEVANFLNMSHETFFTSMRSVVCTFLGKWEDA